MLGSDAVLRHACFSGCNREIRDRRTSLGAGATERPDGAHEDNEGHESSHSNADDHRHWERLCREQQREVSYDHYILQTSRMHMKREYTTAHSHDTDSLHEATFLCQKHTYTSFPHLSLSFLSLQQTGTKGRFAVFFILLSDFDIIPQAQGHAITTHRHNATEKNWTIYPNYSNFKQKLISKPFVISAGKHFPFVSFSYYPI